MIFSDGSDVRRPNAKELQKIFGAAPSRAWAAPKEPPDGLSFRLTSRFDLREAQGAVATALAGPSGQSLVAFDRTIDVEAAGDYLRMADGGDAKGDDAVGGGGWSLSHPVLGAVHVDARQRSYLHLGVEHLALPLLPAGIRKVMADWTLATEGQRVVLRAAGPYGIALHLTCRDRDDATPLAATAMILRAVLPGLGDMAALGLPFDALCRLGVPEVIEVRCLGEKARPMAVHTIEALQNVRFDPDRFALPDGYQDLRHRREAGKGQAKGTVLAQRPLGTAAPQPHHRTQGSMSMVAALPGLSKIELSDTPILPSCGPVAYVESGAMAVRQSLLDAVTEAANLLTSRFGSFGAVGATVDGERQLRFAVDWLNQIDALPATDSVRLVAEVVVNQLARSLARQLCAENPPIPFGGAGDPIALNADIAATLLALAADPAIAPNDRFDRLSDTEKAIVVAEVINARLAVLPVDIPAVAFNGPLPSEDLQLVDVRAVLETGRLTFANQALVNTLSVRDFAPGGPPGITMSLSVSALALTVGMTRTPGEDFWITAAGVLVVGGLVVAAAVPLVIATLLGLGPFGLVLLGLGLMSLGTLALAAIAGGALLLAAVVYLVWDETTIGVDVSNLTVTSRLRLGANADGSALVLRPSATTTAGTVTIALASEIPSGMHQIFDRLVEMLIVFCDTEVRKAFRRIVSDTLGAALAEVPLVRTPLSGRTDVTVAALLDGAPISDGTPDGILTGSVPGIVTRLEQASVEGRDDITLTAGALAGMEFPFPALRPFATQVSAVPAPRLDRRVAATEAADQVRRGVLLGHTVSQNMLNGVAHARWLTGRLARDLSAADTRNAFAALAAADARFAAFAAGGQRVHVFCAASPRILVSPRTFASDPTRPCLHAGFADIRVCFESVFVHAPASIEFRIAAETQAHLALGAPPPSRAVGFSLLAVAGAMLHLRYDASPASVIVHPAGAQAVVGQGTAEDLVDRLDLAAVTALLDAMQPTLERAAETVIARDGLGQIVFETPDGPRNVQIADSAFLVETTPEAEALHITVRLLPFVADRLPFTGPTGTFQSPRIPL